MSEEYSDQILDYLTAEMLNGPKPPDLSARIEAAWAAEKDAQSTDTPSSPNLNLPASDPALLSQPPVAPPVQVRKESFESVERRSPWIPALAASAALLVAAIAWTVWPEDNNVVAEAEDTGSEVEREGSKPSDLELAGNPSTDKVRNIKPGSRGKASPTEELDLDSLPFNPAGNEEQPPGEALLANSFEASEPIDRAEITSQVDQQFAKIWSSLGVQPSTKLPDPLLKTKLVLKLIGAESLEETSGSLEIDPSLEAAAFVEQLVDTPEVASLLASRLGSALVGRNPDELQQADGAIFRSLASDTIAEGKDWNSFIKSVLSADLSEDAKGPLDLAGKFVFSKVAVGDKHRFMNHLGSNLLNTNTSCVRCHDNKSQTGPTLKKQESYWSMVALLNGVQVRRDRDDGSLNLTDRQGELFADPDRSPVVYYTLPDGQVLSATASIPGSGDWKKTGAVSPRAAMAAWVTDSSRMDEAVVNQTWKMLFGRHLVPHVQGIDVVAIPERQAVLDMLASQYRAHGRDVRSLVTWIASTDLYALAPVVVSRQQWLEESDEAFEKLQLAELAFAVPSSLGTQKDASSLASSLEMMQRFSGSGPSLDDLPTTLAQPKEEKPGKSKEVVLDMPSSSFVVHRDRPTAAELSFIEKLLKASELSWDEKVDHVVSLFPDVNGRPRDLDAKLLEYHDGDTKEALITLLWAVKNNSARSLR